ncbi:MAG: VOC family protein [Myxococcota bacterium]
MKNPARIQPYLAVRDAPKAIDLYTRVFGMKEVYRLRMGDRVGHAELELGDSRILLSSEFPEMGVDGPETLGGTTVSVLIYVDDVDRVVAEARKAGFQQEGETKDEFFGDRAAKLTDPFGHRWFVHQRMEELEPQEIVDRFEKMMKGQ